MDCDYVLVCKSGLSEESVSFHETTPEEAKERARRIVFLKQKENVDEFPFSPVVVTGVLYRGFCEFDGGEFITPKIKPDPSAHDVANGSR